MNSEKIIIGAFKFELPSTDFEKYIDEIQKTDNWKNKEIEKIGKLLLSYGDQSNPIAWWYFSRLVCSWGRGMRVWANYNRLNNADPQEPNEGMGKKLKDAFLTTLKKNSAHDAMEYLLSKEIRKVLNGLNVSYLSKHLRMLKPEKYAVLDSVLSSKTGFAMNPNGYEIFMDSLEKQLGTAKRLSGKCFHLADFEAAIFLLAGGGAGESNVSHNHEKFLQEAQAQKLVQ